MHIYIYTLTHRRTYTRTCRHTCTHTRRAQSTGPSRLKIEYDDAPLPQNVSNAVLQQPSTTTSSVAGADGAGGMCNSSMCSQQTSTTIASIAALMVPFKLYSACIVRCIGLCHYYHKKITLCYTPRTWVQEFHTELISVCSQQTSTTIASVAGLIVQAVGAVIFRVHRELAVGSYTGATRDIFSGDGFTGSRHDSLTGAARDKFTGDNFTGATHDRFTGDGFSPVNLHTERPTWIQARPRVAHNVSFNLKQTWY